MYVYYNMYMYTYVCMHVHVNVYMCVCMYMYMYVQYSEIIHTSMEEATVPIHPPTCSGNQPDLGIGLYSRPAYHSLTLT